MEIERKSAHCEEDLILAFGRMIATFHCAGMKWEWNERLIRWEPGIEKEGGGESKKQSRKVVIASDSLV